MSEITRTPVVTTGAPTPKYSYSQGIVTGDLLFVAGQVGIEAETRAQAPDFESKVRQALANVAAIAEAAGTSLNNAVRIGVFLEDLNQIEVMDAIYREHFEEPRPSRTTVQAFLRGQEVEIDAVILVPRNE
ncbi:RidA family protein [Rhodococcus sp. NPDC060176]|uniref:RidA family protein n=1 Tax=Rhodococcus sp. NPDC060176 TaxID=3347062 RepID=UPI00364D1D3B